MRNSSSSIVIKTPAKINLLLIIQGKRSDGYHEIVTVMQMVDLYDEIIINKSDELKFICLDPHIPSGEDNLIVKAALSLKKASKTREGAHITLHKTIPVAAGLGGGSSDAAATLFGLNLLWDTGYSNERLAEIGKELGSDVPFFFYGPAAMGFGRGDQLIPLSETLDYWYLLSNPGIHVSTSWAYGQASSGHLESSHIKDEQMWLGPFRQAKIELTNEECHIKMPLPNGIRIEENRIWISPYNDLEEVVSKRYPEIRQIKDRMFACDAISAQMSGSGSTVFGVFKDRSSAERAYRELQKSGWRSWLVKALKSSPYSESNHQT